MDEFSANKIMEADKMNVGTFLERRKGNVFQVDWDIQLTGYKGKLKLQINYVENNEIRRSFSETYENACLRRLEVPLVKEKIYNHRNSKSCGNSDIFSGIHKHRYLDRVKDGCAYVPNDIDITSLQSIIRTFASECKITLTGNLPRIVEQRRLF